jgi:hypothetical protein
MRMSRHLRDNAATADWRAKSENHSSETSRLDLDFTAQCRAVRMRIATEQSSSNIHMTSGNAMSFNRLNSRSEWLAT